MSALTELNDEEVLLSDTKGIIAAIPEYESTEPEVIMGKVSITPCLLEDELEVVKNKINAGSDKIKDTIGSLIRQGKYKPSEKKSEYPTPILYANSLKHEIEDVKDKRDRYENMIDAFVIGCLATAGYLNEDSSFNLVGTTTADKNWKKDVLVIQFPIS